MTGRGALVGVVGAGQMGAGIAQVCAQAGMKVVLYDAEAKALERGKKGIEGFLNKSVEKQKIGVADAAAALSRIELEADIKNLKACDLVIEAIVENAEVKMKLFRTLDELLAPEAIIASNTSSISITRLASSTKRPDKFIGVHFMNPVPIMTLVELIRGLQTSDQTYQDIVDLMKRIGKTTVTAIDGPGFIVNRILVPMVNEAIFLLQEGVRAEDIDTAMKLGTNQPMGPLELADFVGLDTLLYILQVLHRELGEDKYRPCPLLVKYVEAGWYGKKNGRGIYKYPRT
jgi:3-hydroxybutyryl-CoA dehydrogenase